MADWNPDQPESMRFKPQQGWTALHKKKREENLKKKFTGDNLPDWMK